MLTESERHSIVWAVGTPNLRQREIVSLFAKRPDHKLRGFSA